MKKYLVLIALAIIAILSCEKDDICLEGTTPNLIISFYNKDTLSDKKEVTKMDVWAEGKDSIYTEVTKDSIFLPLDLNNNITTYNIRTNDIVDQITVKYTRNEIYVSRSCGYKFDFEDVETSSTFNWIDNIILIDTIINHEETAHIHITH